MSHRVPRAAALCVVPLYLVTLACGEPAPATKESAAERLEPRMQATVASPPVASVEPTQLEMHGDVRTDDYYWLKERDNPEVIAYLEAENAYLDAVMAPVAEAEGALFEEIVGRIQKTDESVPFKDGDYYYYTRFEEGGEYEIFCRRKGSLDASEEVLLDGNRLAEGQEYFSMRGERVSPGQDIVAYAVDTVGRRFYNLRFRDLTTGEDLPDRIVGVTSNGAWANDNRTFFYTRQHSETLRWHRIYRHVLGTDPATDELVYEEMDEEYSSFVYKSKSERFIFLGSQQTLATEIRVLDADRPDTGFEVFQPREVDHEYWIDHGGDAFYIKTNWDAPNFRLMKAAPGATTKESWVEVIPHREDVFLEDMDLFRNHLVASERKGGLKQVRILPADGSEGHYLDFGEPAYLAYLADNAEYDTGVVRYRYTSLTTPNSTYDYDMTSREKTLLKEEPVLGGFDKNDYRTERLMAPATDGTLVPVSIVYREGLERDGSNPLLLYAYGSYGSSVDASFRSYRLSLLDRGFAFAIAHIRGGQEMGRQWYEDGKLFNKINTFTDFIDVGRYLVSEGHTNPDRLYAEGGSAGGLLMGAVTNMAPELFHGVVSHVPFVDVVTTMLDPDIPLTTSEYDEWGNPNDQAAYEYMLSYSPYDNVEAKAYPNLLVTTGLHDSQVQYWEPAKYVARLRAVGTGDNLVLLKTNMEAGHGGASGRFKRHRETARVYAFLLDLAGVGE